VLMRRQSCVEAYAEDAQAPAIAPTGVKMRAALARRRPNSVADLGFGKDGCPIHQKGAPETGKPPTCAPKARAGGGSGASPRKFESLDTL